MKSLVQIAAVVLLILIGSAPAMPQTISVSPDATIPQILDYMVLLEPGDVEFDEKAGVLRGKIALGHQSQSFANRPIEQGSWLGGRLTNETNLRGEWRLDTEFAMWESNGVVYLVRDGKAEIILAQNWATTKIKDRIPPERIVTSKPIVLEPGQSADIWIKFQAPWSTHHPLRLVTPSDLLASRHARAFAFGRHNGIGFTLVVMMLVFWWLLRFKPAFYFSIFFSTMLAGNLLIEGYPFFYLYPNAPYLNVWTLTLFRVIMCFTYLQFIRSFLRSPEQYPRLDKAMRVLMLAVTVCAVWIILASGIGISAAGSVISSLLILVSICVFVFLIFLSGILSVKDRIRGGYFFLIGNSVFIFSSTSLIFTALGISSISLRQSNDIVAILQLLHGAVFAAAVIFQAFGLRQERDNALNAEILTSKENLKIANSLIEARSDRDRARTLAEQSQMRLATASHDLRQPLTSLKLALEQADEGNPDLKQKLEAGLEYLDGVLGEALSDSRPQEHAHLSKQNDYEAVPLAIIFENIERMFRSEAEVKGLDFLIIPCEAEALTEPVILIRILSNLISNAIRYTEAGHVRISADIQGETISIEVSDTGPGVSTSEFDRLAAPYQRGEAGVKGEGLGLHIVSKLADQTGLTFECESQQGGGSIFRLNGLRRS